MASTTNDGEVESENFDFREISKPRKPLTMTSQPLRSRQTLPVKMDAGISEKDKISLKRRALQTQDATKKRKSFVKKFRREWMDEPIFRGWLEPIPDNTEKCWCNVCKVILLCGHSELEKHASGKKHSDLMSAKTAKEGILAYDNVDLIMNDLTKDDSMDSGDMGVPVLALAQDDSSDSQVVFHVAADGTLQEVNMAEYGALLRKQEKNENIVSTIGHTSITKGISKTVPTILRAKRQVVVQSCSGAKLDEGKKHEQKVNKTWNVEEVRRLAELSTDDDDEYWEDEISTAARDQQNRMDMKNKQDDELNATNLHPKELEMRLLFLKEKKRQRFNLYKLKLDEMYARVRLADEELARSAELHKLKVKHLQLQIRNEEEKIKTDVT